MRERGSVSILAMLMTLCCFVGGPNAAAQTTNPAISGPGASGGDSGLSGAIEQKLILSQAQRAAIYQEVSKDKSKVAPKDFSPVIGGDVSAIALHEPLGVGQIAALIFTLAGVALAARS